MNANMNANSILSYESLLKEMKLPSKEAHNSEIAVVFIFDTQFS